MPNRTRAGKCINAVSAAANEFGMIKKGKAQKKTPRFRLKRRWPGYVTEVIPTNNRPQT